jgi:hypothetical protein
MDTTGLCQNMKRKKVLAVHGSKNVWFKWADCLVYLIVAGFVGANEFAAPPLLSCLDSVL